MVEGQSMTTVADVVAQVRRWSVGGFRARGGRPCDARADGGRSRRRSALGSVRSRRRRGRRIGTGIGFSVVIVVLGPSQADKCCPARLTRRARPWPRGVSDRYGAGPRLQLPRRTVARRVPTLSDRVLASHGALRPQRYVTIPPDRLIGRQQRGWLLGLVRFRPRPRRARCRRGQPIRYSRARIGGATSNESRVGRRRSLTTDLPSSRLADDRPPPNGPAHIVSATARFTLRDSCPRDPVPEGT
jgi:hypothetical protein